MFCPTGGIMLTWRSLRRYVSLIAFLLIVFCAVFAIKQNQKVVRIQKDISEIKALLSKPGSPQQPPQVDIKGVEFDIGDNPVLGSESARLILVEFTDYQCQFCGRYSRETFPQIREQYVDKGVLRYVVIDQPLPIHPDAPKAAEASHCAEDQGKFWEIHEEMMAKQENLKDLSTYARSLDLNIGQFEECLNTGKYRDAVRKDMELANKLGVNGVPGFIIGTIDRNDPRKVTGISMIRGAVPFANFQKELDAVLLR